MSNKLKAGLILGIVFLVLILTQPVLAEDTAYCVEEYIGKGVIAETYLPSFYGNYFKYNQADSFCAGAPYVRDFGNTRNTYSHKIYLAYCKDVPNVASLEEVELDRPLYCKQKTEQSTLTLSGLVPAYVVTLSCLNNGTFVFLKDSDNDILESSNRNRECYNKTSYSLAYCKSADELSFKTINCSLLITDRCVNGEYPNEGRCVKTCTSDKQCKGLGSAYTCDLTSPLVLSNRQNSLLSSSEGICINNSTSTNAS